jgi:hypothetical protein
MEQTPPGHSGSGARGSDSGGLRPLFIIESAGMRPREPARSKRLTYV